MWLKFLRLKNYDYFLTGMDKDEIEMKFTKEDDIIVITGDVGTGKSSLVMIATSPYPRTSRGYGIKEGKEGKKIQRFVDEENNCEYQVIHEFYPKSNGSHKCKSYLNKITEEGKKELNKSGKVTLFREIVEEEFSISRNDIGALNLNCDDYGIVSKTPAERRDTVKEWVNGLEEVDEKLPVVDQKYRTIKREREANELKLEQYPDSEKLDKDISDIKEKKSMINNKLEKVYRKLGSFEELNEEYYQELSKELKEKDNELKTIKNIMSFMDENDINNSIQYKIDGLSGNLSRRDSKIKDINEDLEKINKDIIDNNKEIKSLKELEDNKEYIEKLKKKLNNIKNDVQDLNIEYTEEEFDKISSGIKGLFTSLDTIIMNIENKNILKNNMDENYLEKLLDKFKSKINKIDNKLDKKQGEYNKLKRKDCDSYGDVKVHPECELEDCGIRKMVENACDNKKELNELENEIEKISNEREELNYEFIQLKDDVDWCKRLLKKFNDFNIQNLLCKDSRFNEITLGKIINHIKKGGFENFKSRIGILLEDFRKYYDYKHYESKIKSSSTITDREKKLLNKYIKENNKLKNKRKELEKKKKKLFEESKDIEEVLKSIKSKFNIDHFLKNMDKQKLKEHRKDIGKEKDELLKEMSTIEKKKKRKKELEQKEIDLKGEIKTLDNELNKLKSKKNVMEHLEKEYLRLVEEERIAYGVREVLRIHLPIKVMDKFLESVKVYSNEFLSNVNLPYRISEFELDEKEFRVETVKNGSLYDDVSGMSKGERALMSVAIWISNLVILEDLKNYGIVSLDEIDANLKYEKKEIYKNIILRQFKNFGLSQIFIVSHNENFTNMNDVSHICFENSNVDIREIDRVIYHHDYD